MTDDRSAALLGEIAMEAGIERASFLTDAADQLEKFLKANAARIRDLGGMVLIDDDPDYLSIAPDGTFRSRTRYQDQNTGDWISETEVIESAAELVELYNPADIYQAFADAAEAEWDDDEDGDEDDGEDDDQAAPVERSAGNGAGDPLGQGPVDHE
jgi:hypothetical protein